MSCPSSEEVSRHLDGSLRDDAVARHLASCAVCGARADGLKSAIAWLATGCLSVDEMAALLEDRGDRSHLESCSRCAAEFRALGPARKRATTRIRRRASQPSFGWMGAVAATLLFGLAAFLVLRSNQPQVEPDVVRQPPPPGTRTNDVPPATSSKLTPPVTSAAPPPSSTASSQPVPPLTEMPAPASSSVQAPPPPSSSTDQPAPTTTQPPDDPAPAREVAVIVRGGSVTHFESGKWTKPDRVLEGMTLRAEGKTRIEFAGARVTLDSQAKFSLARQELALKEGGLSADVSRGSKVSLLLGSTSIVPLTDHSRVLLAATPERVVVEEGAARAGDVLLGEDLEHEFKAGRIVPRKRSLPPAARAREALTWVLDIQNPNATRGKLDDGRLVMLPSGRAIESTPIKSEYYASAINYFAGGDVDSFVVKPTTAIRFRYLAKDGGAVHFQIKNRTKNENFNTQFDAVAGRWTTCTIPVLEIPVNTGGLKVTCEVGDKYGRISWSVGKPGKPVEFLIDRFEIVEIEK